jgi:hypothetical protein
MRKHIFFFISIFYISAGIVFGIQYAYATIPINELPESVQKKIGYGKQISMSGWAWNSAMGWIAQRTIPTSGQTSYGVIKDAAQQVFGWSWSSNYGWICWGKTCKDAGLDVPTYGKNKPLLSTREEEPDIRIEVVQTFPVLGDNTVEGTEQCDHGNNNGVSGDSCGSNGKGIPASVGQAVCGNGLKEGTEICDDGDFNDANACKSDCTGSGGGVPNFCGDGVKDSGEECDDGDRDNTNTCKNDCTFDGAALAQNTYAFPVRGWIKAIGLKDNGWIRLQGTVECDTNNSSCTDNGKEYGVIYDPDHKEFRGWAWSPTFGWIVFSGRTLYDTPYRYAKITLQGSTEPKTYDVVPFTSQNTFKIDTQKANGIIREYQLNRTGNVGSYIYSIARIIEFKVLSDGSVDSVSVTEVTSGNRDTVEIFDETACQRGCDISYFSVSGKSTWKTQLLSSWIQTVGGNIFSRKGFGGTSAGGRNSQYLMYSGGITLERDVRQGEKLELSCCINNLVYVTKIGKPEKVQGLSSSADADLLSGNEIHILKQGIKIKKKTRTSVSDASSDLQSIFLDSLLEGEERILKKNNTGDVEASIAYSLYASLENTDAGMNDGDVIRVIKNDRGEIEGEGNGLSPTLKTALSSQKRIIGAITNWTSDCDDATKQCNTVGRKKTGATDIIKTDAFKRENRPDIAFPQKIGNIRRNTLGLLDIGNLVAFSNAIPIIDENGFGNYRTAGMGGNILVVNGDLVIGQGGSQGWTFSNGSSGKSGAGTILVRGGNLIIKRPITYNLTSTVSDMKQLASIAWIVLEEGGKGGNIIFDNCIPPKDMTFTQKDLPLSSLGTLVSITQAVAPVAGIFFAEGTISTGTGDASQCAFSDDVPLYVDGMMIARTFRFQRIYSGDTDLNVASEFIQDTGRAIVNTPPGLTDILKSLPVW